MFQEVVVPIDGSAASWRAVPIAARMAAAVDGKLDLVTVVDRIGMVGTMESELAAGLERAQPLPVEVHTEVIAGDTAAEALAEFVEERNGAIVVMSSHGHGRSASVLGSTVDELLRATFGPVVVVGPKVSDDAGSLDGRYLVPLDGSEHGDAVLPIASAWTVEFGGEPWLVEVLGSRTPVNPDYTESAYPARRARKLTVETGHEFEFDVLHGTHPGVAITDQARSIGASLIFASTHGRTGMERLHLGSVTADMVRHATCPVVLFRPPELAGT
jgi:nucleotide-binding universal stress UspA family protein